MIEGSALPHLYVGLEYGSTGNHEQEETFLKHAIQIEPDDPLILQELGVNAFYLKNFDEALSYFFKAIQIIRASFYKTYFFQFSISLRNNFDVIY